MSIIECLECGQSFSRPYTLKRHVEIRHSEHHGPGHQCEACGKTFERKDRLARHKKIHSGAGLERCERCGRGFRRDYLKQHTWSCLARVPLGNGQASQPDAPTSGPIASTFIHNGIMQLTWNNEREPAMRQSGVGGKRKRDQVQFIQQTRRDFTQTNALTLRKALIYNDLAITGEAFEGLGRDSGRLQDLITSTDFVPKAILREHMSAQTIRHFVSLGMDFTLVGKRFPDILHKAVEIEDCLLVAALLDAKIDVNGLFKRKTALDVVLDLCTSDDHESYDVTLESLDVVKVLLERGAEIGGRSEDAEQLLRVAATESDVELVRLLLMKGVAANSPGGDGFTPLHLATRHGASVECVEILISHCATVDAADHEYRSTALCYAARHRNINVMTCLVKHGASINGVPGDWGRTPLFNAAQFHNLATIQLLVDRGADVNVCRPDLKDGESTTALSLALSNRNVLIDLETRLKTIDTLLAAGADPNLGDDNALNNALRCQPLKVVQILLQGRADPELLDDECWDHLINPERRCRIPSCPIPYICKGYHDAEAKLRLLEDHRDRWNI